VLLDHGLYETLSEETRINFASFWRAIFLQEEKNLEKFSLALGTSMYKLFTCKNNIE
jgi:predicted unusual protein kinase regulating ubiquinone biosynthesis (AarF/ABC1/UbiB family)